MGANSNPGVAPGVMPPGTSIAIPNQAAIPFTRAVGVTRDTISVQTSKVVTASQQSIVETIPGTGFMIWLDLEMVIAGTGNATGTTVAAAEDAPWSAFASITLDDGGPQMVNIDGYSLHLLNLYGGFGMYDSTLSTDTSIFSNLTTGTGSAAGSGTFRLRIPAAINDRDYWGLLGNQDRATKYNLRDDLAASGSIWTTAPSTLPAVTINRHYGFIPVPGPTSADGRPQEQLPPTYGIVHYMSAVKSDALPVGGQMVNHYVRNLSNAVRAFILVLRSGTGTTPRASAEAALPTQIDFSIGTDVIYSETARERRQRMWDMFRFDAPDGVLVYGDFMDDFSPIVGYEMGYNYLFLGNVSEAQFRLTYPAGMGSSTSNSLTIITDSLYIPPEVNIYGPLGA